METELTVLLRGQKRKTWEALLRKTGLEPDDQTEITALVWDGDELTAAGSRQGNLLKCIAVDPARQGEGLTAKVITALRQDAFSAGHRHLFLYTKPSNEWMFSSLFFYPVAKTADVLLMEDRRQGIEEFLGTLSVPDAAGTVGAAVMNCNPFTKGHRYLIETAAAASDHLLVFVLSEDRSRFSAEDRMNMVRLGTADLPNVTVLPTGPYLISSATFPTYFLKDREQKDTIQCQLDVEIFARHFAPRFSIRRRFVGTEPLSPMTECYNRTLKACLPPKGVEVVEIPRLETDGVPVSASAFRNCLDRNDLEAARQLVPETTWNYLQAHGLLPTNI